MNASGMKYHEIIADFPELTESDIQAALSYASHREGEIIILGDANQAYALSSRTEKHVRGVLFRARDK